MKFLIYPVFILFAIVAWCVQSKIPFHNAWDMDLITVMDLYQMADGLLPQHINHPGMGLYLIQRWFWYLADLSAHNLTQVLSSPIPLLPIAEATLWARSLTVIPVTLTLVGCTLGLIRLLPLRQTIYSSLAIAMVIATWAGFWGFHVVMIRTEMYAIGFYSIAFALIGWMTRGHKSHWRLLLVFILAGVGFLTKFQGFFLHAALLILVMEALPEHRIPSMPRSRVWTFLFIGLFALVCVLAWLSYIPTYFATFSPKKKPSLFFFIVLGGLLLPFIKKPIGRIVNATIQLKRPWLFQRITPNEHVLHYANIPYWAVLGLLLAFAFHFLMFMTPGNSLEYFFFDWRMIFLKVSSHNTPQSGLLSVMMWNLKFHLVPVGLWLGACVYVWNGIDLRKRGFILVYSLLILASLALVSRGRVQDSIWNDVLILWGFRLILPNLQDIKVWKIPALLSLVVVWNITHFSTPSVDNVRIVDQGIHNFWEEPYESPVNKYTELMAEIRKDPFMYEQINRLSLIQPSLRKILKELWTRPQPDLTDISVASPEFKNYIVIRPRRNESVIRPKNFTIWLGAVEVENITDCPLTPQVVTRGDVRWRQVWPGTKKCNLLSKKVKVAFNFADLLARPAE